MTVKMEVYDSCVCVCGSKCFVYLAQIPRRVINQQYNSSQINELTGAFELALEMV